ARFSGDFRTRAFILGGTLSSNPVRPSGESLETQFALVGLARRKTVVIGIGNNFSNPTTSAYQNCLAATKTHKICLSHDDHGGSIVALDMKTGKIKWSQRLTDGDRWPPVSDHRSQRWHHLSLRRRLDRPGKAKGL